MAAINNRPRLASDPYTLSLGAEPYILTEEMIQSNTDDHTKRKRDWSFPAIKFISFKKGKLELKISSENTSWQLHIGVKEDQLQVSCSCGTEVPMLCRHAYKVFGQMTGFDDRTDYFVKFRPGGMVDIAFKHRKYFTTQLYGTDPALIPNPELNSVYTLEDRVDWSHLPNLLNLPVHKKYASPAAGDDKAICYIVVDSYRKELLPFLVPCLGKLNKAGTAIKGFDKFISGTQKEYEAMLTDDQRTLNKLCFEMYRLVEKQPGSLFADETIEPASLIAIFDYWKKVFSLLQHQPFVYSYTIYRQRDLKYQPSKSRISPVHIMNDTPALHFHLADKGVLFGLTLNATVQGKLLKNAGTDTFFFLCQGENLCLLSSVRDAAIAEWMNKSGGCISIFKEHFKEFENSYLKQIRESYPVQVIGTTKKKKK